MSLEVVQIIFQIVAFLFAISVHESAHAWMALRCGDPTAYMLGRVTLNPIKHIDPVGTILLPAIAMFSHLPVIGWARPTPVNPRNFKHYTRDDILTSVAGPVSNLIVAAICAAALFVVVLVGREEARGALHNAIIFTLTGQMTMSSESALVPLTILLYGFIYINLLLAVFNLIPIPPLDGSHVIRHMLSPGALEIYDRIGMFGLVLFFLVGGRVLSALFSPVLGFFNGILLRF